MKFIDYSIQIKDNENQIENIKKCLSPVHYIIKKHKKENIYWLYFDNITFAEFEELVLLIGQLTSIDQLDICYYDPENQIDKLIDSIKYTNKQTNFVKNISFEIKQKKQRIILAFNKANINREMNIPFCFEWYKRIIILINEGVKK